MAHCVLTIEVFHLQKSILVSSLLVVIIITAIAGCTGSEDIRGVMDSWNKVMGKEYQIEKVLVDNAAFQTNDLEKWTQQQQNTIGKLEVLLQEENSLISDFAGSTAKVNGDANRYANEALLNIRETYNYRVDALQNFKELVAAKQVNDDKLYAEKKKSTRRFRI